jgi:hypothetical protein
VNDRIHDERAVDHRTPFDASGPLSLDGYGKDRLSR